ncbi:hypothetical protein [Mariniplasma anaerobium]|uniref:Uncharacterized protein n=1 Tax=Mariniplasma anaerobium TaxID=2735436 RepID=A0A7U9TKD3_9MOLU|nr:hypothetical protein [Mariniplasma anaerobium]BCR35213.1 hypothetical protein MPAN_001060 [Mariniplasma anaerobium]
MKAYFNYLTKTKWLQTMVMALIPTFIFVLTLILNNRTYPPTNSSRFSNDFGMSVIYISIVLIIIVIFRFSSLRNPKEVDLYYALPISRKKLYLVHLLFGFVQLLIVWTIMFILGFITILILSNGYYREGFFFLLYFIVIFYLVILYGITSFVFLRANTIFDGITFILLFHILFLFISLFFSNNLIGIFMSFGLNPFYSLGRWTTYLLSMTAHTPSNSATEYFVRALPSVITNTLVFMGLATFCYIYNYKMIEQEKTENIGQISDSKFGYRLYIPLSIIFGVSTVSLFGGIIIWLINGILVSAGFIGFFIFRRTAKIKLIDVGYILVSVIIGIILGILIN